MQQPLKRRKATAAIAVVAALVLSAFAATSASAAEWVQGETTMKWTASEINLTKNGGSPVSCSLEEAIGEPNAFWQRGAMPGGIGGVTTFSGPIGAGTELACGGGTSMEFCACIEVQSEIESGVFSVDMWNFWPGWVWMESPYGEYSQAAITGTFVNGNGSQPSTLTFEKQNISAISPQIHISGTFQVTQEDGSLLTLEP